MRGKNRCILGCCIMVSVVSCDSEPVSMSAEERYVADTIFTRQFPVLRTETDSLCAVVSDSIYQHLVDSLTDEYMKEIEYLLKDHIIEE